MLTAPAQGADLVLGGTMQGFLDRWTAITGQSATMGECSTDIPRSCEFVIGDGRLVGVLQSGRDGETLDRVKFWLGNPADSDALFYESVVDSMKVLAPEADEGERREADELILGHVPDEGSYDIVVRGVNYTFAQDLVTSEVNVAISRASF